MGSIFSGVRNGRIEEVDMSASNAYCFPPKSGQYFASHFIMGGERFEAYQPESYLFGENMDLNFLGVRPTPFPYSAPLPHEPTRTLRALINIRKESLRFVKVNADSLSNVTSETTDATGGISTDIQQKNQYNIEFMFDTDIRCSITIYYFCTEEITPNAVIYTPKDPSMSSETYLYKRGSNQQFSQSSHIIDPSLYSDDELLYRTIDEHGEYDPPNAFPVVIQCVSLEGDDPRQSHSLFAIIERNHDNTFSLKPLKQKIFVDGLCYLLQEIYGIENKNAMINNEETSCEEEIEDNSSECVICMSDSRDTLILPCRHLCLCNGCADSLRYQANNCPICRAPFRALLQIKAVKKVTVPSSVITSTPSTIPHHHQMMPSNSTNDLIDIPPGYEPISLIEALNGPQSSRAIFKYRASGGDSLDTPTNIRKYKNDNRTKKSISASNNGDASSASLNAMVGTPQSRIRKLLSPSTPEVVVSAMPLSPDKEVTANVESNLNNNHNVSLGEVKERDRWRVSLVSNSKSKTSGDDNGSASSTSSSVTTENISVQERVRLLASDKDHDVDDESGDKFNDEYETEMHSFKVNPASPPSLIKDSPGNSSPLSIGVSSGSYAMMSLRDGLDEQRTMDEVDLVSIATISSANNALIARPDDGDESDYYTHDDTTLDNSSKRANVSTLLGDDSNADISEIEKNVEKSQKENVKFKTNSPIGKIKLAETENTDDSDLSPSEL